MVGGGGGGGGGGGDQMNGWRARADADADGRRDEEGREGRPESAAKVPKIPTVGSEIAGRWEGRRGGRGKRAGRRLDG